MSGARYRRQDVPPDPVPERIRWVHACPSCGLVVRWALTYCTDCRGPGTNNPPWLRAKGAGA